MWEEVELVAVDVVKGSSAVEGAEVDGADMSAHSLVKLCLEQSRLSRQALKDQSGCGSAVSVATTD